MREVKDLLTWRLFVFMGLSKSLGRFFIKLFSLDKYEYNKIQIKKQVVTKIMLFARGSYPKEFIAILKGEVKDKVVIIDDVMYQQYSSSVVSTSMRMNLPVSSGSVGTVHSHPSHNSRPSQADLQSFSKRGLVHFIINFPYRVNDLRAYNSQGDVLEFDIVE